ncbi:hypothetical protein AVEN_162257-1 [Araneus ventricosus]|uniref:Uncharacterized protein n=1 Tax=Araneus ventricosus TaxID=182803 RepID=A0A4Y2U691_ARAVE|nr:hypothetical protein AVEN_162257-1 [Araneus ventricosus]
MQAFLFCFFWRETFQVNAGVQSAPIRRDDSKTLTREWGWGVRFLSIWLLLLKLRSLSDCEGLVLNEFSCLFLFFRGVWEEMVAYFKDGSFFFFKDVRR